MNQDENQENDSPKEDILQVAKKRFKLADEAFKDILDAAIEDTEFSAGEQWDDNIKRDREADSRPCLTFNRVSQIVHQVTNDNRQNRPAIKISPVDDQADIEIAKIRQGIIRNIEYQSNADTAYDTAFDRAVRGGLGFWRIVTEYCDPLSFYQDIRIKRIADVSSVRLDPSFSEPDGSDANWGFVFVDLSRDEFRAQYPDADLAKCADNEWNSHLDVQEGWVTENTVRVAEYFYKEYRDTEIVLLSNGQVLEASQIKPPFVLNPGVQIMDSRKTQLPVVKWAKLYGQQVLDERDWPGQWIPIVPVIGEEIITKGKRQLISLVRFAKDPQRMYNYQKSNEAEVIALAPRAPWVGAAGQFEGHPEWAQANRKNFAYLEYNQVDVNGTPAPPPQRNMAEPPVMAISQAAQFAAEDIKATTGVYDAALGAKSNETSGIAIRNRSVQAQTANFHFHDNQAKSIRHTGRIINDLLPFVYDVKRAVRMLGDDNTEKIIRIHDPEFEYMGEKKAISFDVGKYDVTVDTGPSFESKRQEAAAMMADLTKSNPQLMQFAGDLFVQNLDIPQAKEIAERIKKTLPPGLIDDPNNPQNKSPPEVQQQMTQMGQMIEQLTATTNQLQDEKETKLIELQSTERIKMKELEVKLAIETAKIDQKDSIELLFAEMQSLQHRLNSQLKYQQPIEQENNEGQMPDQQMPLDDQQQQPTGGFPPGNSMGV